jgi:Protein of unknown function (DUF3035)
MRQSWTTPILLACCTVALDGCGDTGQSMGRTLGFIHAPPDEFSVTTRAPLAMPPSFALPPPRPGAPRPMEQSESAKAEEALVPQMALGGPPAANSPGQEALVQQAGPPVSSDIRAEVDEQALKDRPSESIWQKMRFWQTPPQPGIVVDPTKEAQRLRENSALGQSPETGETPIVQPKQRAWLQGLF